MEVKIPEVGESIVEVQIGQWLKSAGDAVRKDESLAVIESEKATFELPAPETGKLTRILRQAGDTVHVGATIAQIESDGAAAQPPTGAAQAAAQPSVGAAPLPHPPAKTPAPPPARRPARPPVPAKEQPPTKPKPIALQPAQPEEGPTAPVEEIPPPLEGSSVGAEAGASTPRPASTTSPPEREEEVVHMSMLRRTVARRLLEAQRTMAMLTTFNEVDMSAVQTLRQQHQAAFQRRYGIKLGLMSFFVKAAIAALKEFPQLNTEVRGDDILYHNYFDLGVAIATPQGLVVPVLPNAGRLSFAEVESAVADFARRAKEHQLKPEELQGGTFTITNGGVFGSLLSTPIINPPQSAILGLHAIQDRPVARDGLVVIRPMMYVALTYDHRIVDGREAVLFLRRIKEVIENPARMLIEA